jgi:cytochrome oxidase Cu insertion factor (SCO1/SenC/PrrC family)
VNQPSRKIEWLVWGGLAAVIAVITGAFIVSKLKPAAPAAAPLPIIGNIADFALTNQDNQSVTLASLRGKVWIADIIFTRCAGPCPRMTQQMKSLQDELSASEAKLVTLTTDPEFDTPPVFQKYGTHAGADFRHWQFLTGDKKEVFALAIGSLKLTALPVKPGEQLNVADLFVHSTIFVVVDKQARLRGVFETGGDGVDWNESKKKILSAVQQLEFEP